LVTTPPAPSESIRASDAPVVPSTPAARRRWFFNATPPTVTGPGLIETIHQEMVVIYYKEHLFEWINTHLVFLMREVDGDGGESARHMFESNLSHGYFGL
jgi:hypothetical protein